MDKRLEAKRSRIGEWSQDSTDGARARVAVEMENVDSFWLYLGAVMIRDADARDNGKKSGVVPSGLSSQLDMAATYQEGNGEA